MLKDFFCYSHHMLLNALDKSCLNANHAQPTVSQICLQLINLQFLQITPLCTQNTHTWVMKKNTFLFLALPSIHRLNSAAAPVFTLSSSSCFHSWMPKLLSSISLFFHMYTKPHSMWRCHVSRSFLHLLWHLIHSSEVPCPLDLSY